MKQWNIHLFPFRREQPHPVVILSNDERCLNPDYTEVNAFLCTTVRLNRGPKGNEFILDEADGLDWKTAVRCDLIHLLPKADFGERRGQVIGWRRAGIVQQMIRGLRLPLS